MSSAGQREIKRGGKGCSKEDKDKLSMHLSHHFRRITYISNLQKERNVRHVSLILEPLSMGLEAKDKADNRDMASRQSQQSSCRDS
jgi:hypothetical protein